MVYGVVGDKGREQWRRGFGGVYFRCGMEPYKGHHYAIAGLVILVGWRLRSMKAAGECCKHMSKITNAAYRADTSIASHGSHVPAVSIREGLGGLGRRVCILVQIFISGPSGFKGLGSAFRNMDSRAWDSASVKTRSDHQADKVQTNYC